ncbi:MAG: helicase [Alphaproteobacteria bacterium]|nr:MAG: helicase [Alphaproteobacteria bacterium]
MMSAEQAIPIPAKISLPDIPAIVANARECVILSDEGELQTLPHQDAQSLLYNKTALVCHAPHTKKRLGYDEFYTFDVLELFAFVHPTKFCVPTPVGLARALGLSVPEAFEDYPFTLMDISRTLLLNLQKDTLGDKANPLKIAGIMGLKGKGWPWAHFIFSALGQEYNPEEETFSKTALNVWKHLPEWAEDAPEPPPSHHGVTENEASEKLEELLNVGDTPAEIRPQQKSYSNAMRTMFEPMREDENPHIVLAEAGTGVGKTLGYLAPASVWAEKNEGAVWVSTYTKNLQRQIDSELDRLYPHPEVKNAYVAVRKGRENYLCLLNLEDISAGAALAHNPRHAIAAGIMVRWAASTKDGDLSGNDFPGWLAGLLGMANTYGLADRRGECIFSACDHYHRCFVERSIRKAKRARIIIANHALVMIQSAMSSPLENLPTRYIFDEGHHLFDAADSAFSAHLTARETAELRRWILGVEGNKGRGRGLKRRIEDLITGDEEAEHALQDILHHANALCGMGWSRRFKDNIPNGPTEEFLMQIYRLVYARAQGTDTPYSIETHLHPVDDAALEACAKLKTALAALLKPINALSKIMIKRLVDDQGEMDADIRRRLDTLSVSLERRGAMTLKSWIAMLDTLEEKDKEQQAHKADGFVDWMEVERIDGKSVDVGIYRHYADPMKPFTASVRPHVHGMAVTSATLKDHTSDDELDWQTAFERTGAKYLTTEPHKSSFTSPFNYAENTKVFIVNDVNKNDLGQVSAAYRALFTASNGGALGLFTAVQRLRAVHGQIALPLEKEGITLYGQHMDDMDTGTLIDIFRDDVNSCLLGTDAVRDGVDVPGESLRLLVFDRVPWPRPTILHKARREAFGKRRYDEMITRLKLKQAFGRLIRRADDRGIFVMLDSMLPSRLHGAFPEDTEIIKTGLSDVVQKIREFQNKNI